MVGIASKVFAAHLMAPAIDASGAPTPDLPGAQRELAPTGTLRAAINHNNPLLARRDAVTGELSGLAVDLSQALAQRVGVPLALVPFEAAARITGSAHDDIWDIGYLAIDPSRATDIEFTAAYVELEGTYAVPADSPLRNLGDVDQTGVRLAVTQGSAYDLFLSRTLQHAQLVRVESNPKSVELLFARRVDAVAAVRTVLVNATKQQAGYRVLGGHFMTIPQAAGVPKGRVTAARFVSRFLEDAKASGLVAATLKKFGLGPDDAIVAAPADPG